jgi:DNA-binding transcriptional ArsR family regulator
MLAGHVKRKNAPLDAVFRALSDPTRRSLLARLRKGRTSVGALARPFAMSLPAVSKHLRILESAGLVDREVEGRVHWFALRAARLRWAQRWLEVYRSFWEDTLDALGRHLEGSERGRRRP